MFSESIISVKNLSKCYHVYNAPIDRLKQFITTGVAGLTGYQKKEYFEEFWAVSDVTFEVARGETIGIIGLNGSGKSTLLQMICGTLNPTKGTVTTRGKVAALLELGSGFNPDFTGHENIYMNASVLGLTKKEIDERFNDIVEFASIGEFLDRPVKSYSSGMMVRLAFAVIAHVDADILIIDEALAVGDAVFVQKCMRYIRKFKRENTLIFVSHDTSSVLNLCDTALWVDKGKLISKGKAKVVIDAYHKFTQDKIYDGGYDLKEVNFDKPEDIDFPIETDKKSSVSIIKNNLLESSGWETGHGTITEIHLYKANQGISESNVLGGGELVAIEIKARTNKTIRNPILGFLVRDRLGQDLFGENTLGYTEGKNIVLKQGDPFQAKFTFRMPLLPNGDYSVMASFAEGSWEENIQHHWLNDALIFKVQSENIRFGLVGIIFKEVEVF